MSETCFYDLCVFAQHDMGLGLAWNAALSSSCPLKMSGPCCVSVCFSQHQPWWTVMHSFTSCVKNCLVFLFIFGRDCRQASTYSFSHSLSPSLAHSPIQITIQKVLNFVRKGVNLENSIPELLSFPGEDGTLWALLSIDAISSWKKPELSKHNYTH